MRRPPIITALAGVVLTAALGLVPARASEARADPVLVIVNPAATGLRVAVRVGAGAAGETASFLAGDALTFGVRVNRDAFVYVFGLDSDGNVRLLFPNRLEPGDARLPANVERTFPSAGARYVLRVSGGGASGKVLALATTARLDLAEIARFEGSREFATVAVRGQAALASALARLVEPLPAASWTTGATAYAVGSTGETVVRPPLPRLAPTPAVRQAPAPAEPVVPPQAPAPADPVPPQAPERAAAPPPAPAARAPAVPAAPAPAAGELAGGDRDAAIAAAFERSGGAGRLGRPEDRGRGLAAYGWGGGLAQDFTGAGGDPRATVFRADGASSAYSLRGVLLERFLELARAENGGSGPPARLGWPVGEQRLTGRSPQGTSGLYAPFERGALYWSERYGTAVLSGEVLAVYRSLGGTGSYLGFPTGDQYLAVNGKQAARFEGGVIAWDGARYRAYRN